MAKSVSKLCCGAARRASTHLPFWAYARLLKNRKMEAKRQPLPATILSGFLGSGKTTLLNRILEGAPEDSRIAVLENELGGVPVDDAILAAAEPARLDTVLGRSCCETRTEFIAKLRSVAAASQDFDRLIIESTGVAHPGMLAHAFLADPVLKRAFRIDGIVTVVDAEHFSLHEGGDGHATEQVAYADALVVNKRDLVAPAALETLLAELRRINALARYYVTEHAAAPVAELLDLGGFDLSRIEHGVGGCHSFMAKKTGDRHGHHHEIATVALRLDGRYDIARFRAWIEGFIRDHADRLYRAKGVIALADKAERLVFHGVHGRFQAAFAQPWAPGETPESRLVFIGRELDRAAIEAGLAACKSASVVV